MGLDIRHQVLRVALSVKVNGKRRRLSLHRARPPRTCVKLSMKITVTTSRVGAYPHTQKSGLRRLTGAYPHTKISVAQSYPDPYVFGIQPQLHPSSRGASQARRVVAGPPLCGETKRPAFHQSLCFFAQGSVESTHKVPCFLFICMSYQYPVQYPVP